MREVELTKGKVALIDDADYHLVSEYRWFATKDHHWNRYYAIATPPTGSRKRKLIRMHRLVLAVSDPKILMDHRNGNGLDNRRNNLRVCDHSENAANSRPQSRRTAPKGTYYCRNRNRWFARIIVRGRQIYLGTFSSDTKAALAYNAAARKYFGEFAYPNEVSQ